MKENNKKPKPKTIIVRGKKRIKDKTLTKVPIYLLPDIIQTHATTDNNKLNIGVTLYFEIDFMSDDEFSLADKYINMMFRFGFNLNYIDFIILMYDGKDDHYTQQKYELMRDYIRDYYAGLNQTNRRKFLSYTNVKYSSESEIEHENK